MNVLIAKVLGEAYEGGLPQSPEDAEPDPEKIEALLRQIHDRFVEERVAGFTAPNGQAYPPANPQEVEQRWLRVEPQFRQKLMATKDPGMWNKGLTHVSRAGRQRAYGGSPDWDFERATEPHAIERFGQDFDAAAPARDAADLAANPARRGERAMRDEPSLRHGESLVARIVGQKLDE